MRNFFQPAALARLAVAGLALMASAGLASAQIYIERPAPPRYYPAPQYSPQPYNPGYQYRQAPPRGYYDEYPGYPPRQVRPRQRYYDPNAGFEQRGNMSRICYTGRGPCGIERYQPIGSPCRCKIDGIHKRGQIG